jgi:hypothetical protein
MTAVVGKWILPTTRRGHPSCFISRRNVEIDGRDFAQMPFKALQILQTDSLSMTIPSPKFYLGKSQHRLAFTQGCCQTKFCWIETKGILQTTVPCRRAEERMA